MSTLVPALPDNAVLVHIGPHKTGTTAIQSTLASHRDELVEHGVAYPGSTDAHHQPARALRQLKVGWGGTAPDSKIWDRLAKRIATIDGRVVISSEFFAAADERARTCLVRDIGPERVHVLAAARNPASIALSSWQQGLKGGRVGTLEQWLRENLHGGGSAEKPPGIWGGPDPATMAQRWAKAVGIDRYTVVMLDEDDRRLLPTVFEQLLDLPAGLLADTVPPMRNRGLTAAEAELVRQINQAVKSNLAWTEYNQLLRNGAIRRLVEERIPPSTEERPTLPKWAVERAVEEGRRVATTLTSAGVRIVGDVASLETMPGGADDPADASIEAVSVDAAMEAVVGVVAAATRETWTFASARPETVPTVADLTTRELGRAFGRRVRERARVKVKRRRAAWKANHF